MRYWVFSEEQLERALATWQASRSCAEAELVRAFLLSDEARQHKLQGGASYTPES